MKCRLCGFDMTHMLVPEDMTECHGCWEVYSRLRNIPLSLLKKLLIEAEVNIPKLIKTLQED